MAMSITWTLMVAASLVCGAACGTLGDVTAAAMEGASAAVELTLSMAGALCLWSGVMTVMERGGVTEGLARLFRPLLRRILPRGHHQPRRHPRQQVLLHSDGGSPLPEGVKWHLIRSSKGRRKPSFCCIHAHVKRKLLYF